MEQISTHIMNTLKESGMLITEVGGEECTFLMVQFMRESGTTT